MSYKLVQTYIKTNDQDWSQVILNVENSISSTPDSRDNHSREVINDEIRKKRYSWFSDFKEKAGAAYIGWDREYITDNKLEITHSLEEEAVARILYTRASNSIKESIYTITWNLYDNDGNELDLNQ